MTVTQNVSSALGIQYRLHLAWRPQSSGKVERSNQALKRTLAKLCRETSETCLSLLPVALLWVRVVPKGNILLTTFKIMYGRPFLTTDLLIDIDTFKLQNYVIDLEQVQNALLKYGNQRLPSPTKKETCYNPARRLSPIRNLEGSIPSRSTFPKMEGTLPSSPQYASYS